MIIRVLAAAISVPVIALIGIVMLMGKIVGAPFSLIFSALAAVFTLNPFRLIEDTVRCALGIVKAAVEVPLALVAVPFALLFNVGWGLVKWIGCDAFGVKAVLNIMKENEPLAEMHDFIANTADAFGETVKGGVEAAFDSPFGYNPSF